MKRPKVAIVYDWMDKWGGVERLLLVLHQMYPSAQWFTAHYDPKKAQWAKELKIQTSFMQQLPGFVKKNRALSLPFYPLAFESFDLDDFDVVISITSSFAKGVRVPSHAKHICILLTPTRFLWSHKKYYVSDLLAQLGRPFIYALKKWDLKASQNPDILYSISKQVQSRTKKYYQRTSQLLYPPFDYERWKKIKTKLKKNNDHMPFAKHSYYLVVSRLEKYKKIDLALKLFIQSQKPLVVVGTGSQEKKLKQMASSNIFFLKNLSDLQLGNVYQNAKALIMSQDEDFGYTALEALTFGCPVITYKNSGAAEIVVDKKSGILLEKQTVLSLRNAIERSKRLTYNDRHESDYIRRGGWHKTLATFKKKISQTVRKNNR